MSENVKISKEDFLQIMAGFSQIIPSKAPDFSIYAVAWYWYEEFKSVDKECLKMAFSRHIKKHDHFPSIRQLHYAVNGGVDEETMAKIAAMNIIGAVKKYGYCNWPEARAYIGDIGISIVERFGGWDFVCETLSNDNTSYMLTQFEKCAKSYLVVKDTEYHGSLLPEGKPRVSDIVKVLCDGTKMS